MSTTIRVSKRLAKLLEEQKKIMKVKSIEEVILNLLKERRKLLSKMYFGIDRGKISRFGEEDRLDSDL